MCDKINEKTFLHTTKRTCTVLRLERMNRSGEKSIEITKKDSNKLHYPNRNQFTGRTCILTIVFPKFDATL